MDTTVEEIALVPQNQDNELSNETKLLQTSDNIQHQTKKHSVLSRLFKSNKHLKTFILWIVLFICLLVIAGPLSLHISSSVPSVKTRNVPSHIFSEERARDYLNNLTQYGSRVSHTRGNIDARNYLIRQIKQIFSMSKRHLRFELDLQNLTDSDHQQLQNILVRVSNPTTKSNNVSSLMLSAHYDSVEFSSGSCDDGSGVVVLLELLSNLINDVTMNFSDVHLIVLFTNGEEMGLLGAKAFITNHSWRWNIHRFINVDSTTCTELSGLVHIGSSKMIVDYSRVSRPRANVIFKGILEWLDIRSEYIIYHGIGRLLGYDFGFVIDSYTYHTTLDRPAMIKRGVLQDLGDNLSILIRNILLGKVQKIENVTNTDPLLYFDVLGRYLIMYKTSTSILIQQILIILIIVVSVILIIFDVIHHQTSCSDQQCIYFHFRNAFPLRIISIILYLISNLFSILIGLIFSLIIVLIISIVKPLSWFGNSTLTIFLSSIPCLIGFVTSAYLWNIFHRFILRIYPKNSLENNGTVHIDHSNDVKFDFEQNLSIVLIYGLLMIISIYVKSEILYIILVWSIFICPSYLLLMIIEFIIHWQEIHCNFFEQRYHWLFLPLIICLFPLMHTIQLMNQLVRFLIPFALQRFSRTVEVVVGNMFTCSFIAIPTILFALLLLPILQRTKYFGRTLIIFLITFSITCIVAYKRQPFSNIHPNNFHVRHTSESIFEVETLSNVSSIVPLKSQSSSITVMTYNGFAVSPILDQFSAKIGHILRNKLCSHPTICKFDDTFNRTIAVQNIEIESIKNFTNYKILIRHVLSYNIRILSNSSIKFNVRNQWVAPRTETIIDVTLNSSLSSFKIDIKIIRCDLTDSPFLLLFTDLMENIGLVGDGQCQAIDDGIALIIKQS